MIRSGISPERRLGTITIFDLEFTAWEGAMARRWMAPGEYQEVVQIGAVKLDADTLVPLAEFDVLVRPRFNSNLSPYFEKLTGITNAQLAARGIDFADAYDRLVAFADGGSIAAFGRDDRVLLENLRLYGIQGARALPPFQDISTWFALHGVDPRGLQSCEIGPLLGVPFEGHTHNALNDSRSLAAGMAVMATRGARIAA
jgi:inhibitor of KinA sporulation pathway (predicted exonuclease)